jgi:hypothetical protein
MMALGSLPYELQRSIRRLPVLRCESAYVVEGYTVMNGRLMTVSSTRAPPRMPGHGCGCERTKALNGWVLRLCERHQTEPGIREYCLS